MKKALFTTALVGSLVSGMTVANAATSISGNLAISYFATTDDTSTKASSNQSYNGFGSESQINIAASGDLNNGMKYAAGFSWEIDGTETLGGTAKDDFNAAHEGTYIEFTSGGTTFGVMADRDTSLDGLGVNFAGFGYRQVKGPGTSMVNTSYGTDSNFGFGIRQVLGDGTLSAFYAPNTGYGLTQDIGNGATAATIDKGEHYYSVTYAGKVSGANFKVGMNNTAGIAGNTDQKAIGAQIDYTFGKTKVGISRGKFQNSELTSAAKNEQTTTEIGIGQAFSDTVSGSLTYTKGDGTLAAQVESEKIVTAALGYNLGPVSVQLQYKDAQDIGGVAGTDAQQLGMYVSTKF
jgi:hypothetical protein